MGTMCIVSPEEEVEDKAVLDYLRKNRGGLEPSQVIAGLQSSGLDGIKIRRAMWRLISENLVQLSPDQKLRPSEKLRKRKRRSS